MRIETKLVHAGELEPRPEGAVSMPIFQSSTFEHDGTGDYHDVKYIRLNNTPNHMVLHKKLAALESAEAGLVAGSGMSAISSTLLAFLSSGDHVLAHDCLYGGTHAFITKDLAQLGISCTFVDADQPETWQKHITPETLIARPAVTSHAGVIPEERKRQGISDALVRISVGLEAAEDLIYDFKQALA